ncbi:coiled-coil domain-containing protein [Paenibacillus chungangensis]|uniref:Coiled-coil domain-containing protein n=1 Tax=Paenibacillus chungangensis TaxID=696535 RepID=A0ABW3HX86_9BACL
MRKIMPYANAKTAFILFLISVLLSLRMPVMAMPIDPAATSDDVRVLLEKSLSVVEIDREIETIKQQQKVLEQSMKLAQDELKKQENDIEAKRNDAGKVLRAYYMGERDMLYAALLSSKSWTTFFSIIDYIDIIISKDKHTLHSYIDQYRRMQESYRELEDRETELAGVEQRLLQQRERVLALEAQLEDELQGRTDADRIRLLMEELTRSWEEEGLAKVQEYFQALASAMQKLPGWISDNKDMLDNQGFQYTITVSEAELNDFLQEQDERFKHFSFQFLDGSVTAYGNKDGMEITVTGHYTVEDEPVNGIMFHVDKLIYNGFSLPDTTRRSLEEEFDLGFYPQLILSFLKAKDVEATDGKLTIKLSISL